MNRITLRILAVLLLVLGIVMTASSCKRETAETEAPAETVMAALPTEFIPPETTTPPTTEPPETEPQAERFLLTFAGDCTLGATPANYYAGVGFIKTVGEDYAYPFANVIDYFEHDDFTMVNLEGALCDQGVPVTKKYNFRGPTSYVNILTQNSVEAVTVANNHSRDYGQQGYDATLATLEDAGVPYVEQNASAVVTTESGLTIGLYGMVYYSLDVEAMIREIAAMKEQGVDLIIVAPHWGVEGTYQPTQEQTRVGHAAIDAGANIVFGTHPHVLQPIEEYNGGIIYYSLGNFSFGGNSAPDDFDTALLQQEVIRESDGTVRLGELTVIPACISSISAWNNYQPTPYEPGTEDYDRVLGKLGIWN
ncbi:MAG: CapA family protein [Faecousia sp.]